MPREHRFEPLYRPLLESLRQQSVIGVRESFLCQFPCLAPAQMGFVEQDLHQLGYGHSRVGIVELDCDFVGQFTPVSVGFSEPPDKVG